MDDEPKRSLLWGKNVSEIPCFRSSYLYGISGGIGAGLVYFMFTSRPKRSMHFGVGVFTATTLGYWTYCRYRWEKDKKAGELIRKYIQDRVASEGTSEDITIQSVADIKPSTV
ncbi:hypothetical protein O3M35_013081 [Rhynocoris fuscipes]|uniref:Cytochrome c oxidase assembly protein COX20, mitochondrial n=1 Tax=Rhynocoris fuscipes TaxID=488301 RepID=A0AAW1CE30_9HEMI